jgi:probable F420-dependent oxidoreductase
VVLSAVAASTSRLRLGLGVCLVIQRDPISLAKQVASLDYLSGGRVELGVGGGWNREEMLNHGTDPARRWDVLRERVLAVKEIWTQPEAEFRGEFVNFESLWSWPKPTGPVPVLVGGNGEGTFERVLEYGDAWMPMNRGGHEALEQRITDLQKLASERGRGPIPVTVYGATPTAEAVRRYDELGVDRVLFAVPSGSVAEVTAALDHLADVAGGHLGPHSSRD